MQPSQKDYVLKPGLPDGIFSYQKKKQFWDLGIENVGIFSGRL
jgi:hypothetical protein